MGMSGAYLARLNRTGGDSRAATASPQGIPAEEAKLHHEALLGLLGVVLHAGALEILDGQAVLLHRLGDRVAEHSHAAVVLPEGEERPAQRVARLFDVNDVLLVGKRR